MKKVIVAIMALLVSAVALQGCQSSGQAPVPAPPSATQGDAAKPTPLKAGETPEERVKAYFEAYKAGKLDEAFLLQPQYNQAKQPKAEYTQLRKSMPINEYKVSPPKDTDGRTVIEVEYKLEQYGTWVSSWLFEQKDGKWSVLQYQASQK